MNKHDIDREKRLKTLIDLVKLKDAPLGDEFERAYTDPMTTDVEKDRFISTISRSCIHGVPVSDAELMALAITTSEILTTRKIFRKFEK